MELVTAGGVRLSDPQPPRLVDMFHTVPAAERELSLAPNKAANVDDAPAKDADVRVVWRSRRLVDRISWYLFGPSRHRFSAACRAFVRSAAQRRMLWRPGAVDAVILLTGGLAWPADKPNERVISRQCLCWHAFESRCWSATRCAPLLKARCFHAMARGTGVVVVVGGTDQLDADWKPRDLSRCECDAAGSNTIDKQMELMPMRSMAAATAAPWVPAGRLDEDRCFCG